MRASGPGTGTGAQAAGYPHAASPSAAVLLLQQLSGMRLWCAVLWQLNLAVATARRCCGNSNCTKRCRLEPRTHEIYTLTQGLQVTDYPQSYQTISDTSYTKSTHNIYNNTTVPERVHRGTQEK